MSCEKVQRQISSLLDRKLRAGEREDVLAHLESCRECGARAESLEKLRVELRNLRPDPIPEELHARLRVMASHERDRRLARLNLSARISHWRGHARLLFDNLMRPLALPFAGGSLMALVTFSLLVPSLNDWSHNFGDQSWFNPPIPESSYVPGVVHSAVIVRPEIQAPEGANAVELTIDEQGKVRDYSVVRGQLTPDLQSIIMLPPPFTPATVLGLPVSSKVIVYIPGPNNRS